MVLRDRKDCTFLILSPKYPVWFCMLSLVCDFIEEWGLKFSETQEYGLTINCSLELHLEVPRASTLFPFFLKLLIFPFIIYYQYILLFFMFVWPCVTDTIIWTTRCNKNLHAGSIVGALYHKMLTQSGAAEDGRNYRPKHVELIVIINKICERSVMYFILLTSLWSKLNI